MKKTRTGFLITIILITICHSVSGQSSNKEHSSKTPGPGFKAKDVSKADKSFQNYSVPDPSAKSSDDKSIDAAASVVNHSHTQHAFDFNKLSPDVQDKVSENKIQG
ncbi:MAG: hypothetical protein ACKPAD_04975, partial [Bacteroidota bacterium]